MSDAVTFNLMNANKSRYCMLGITPRKFESRYT